MNFQKRAMYSIKHSFITVLFFVLAIERVYAAPFHSFSEESESFDAPAILTLEPFDESSEESFDKTSEESFDKTSYSQQSDADTDGSEQMTYLDRGADNTASCAFGYRYGWHAGSLVQAKIMHKAAISFIRLESASRIPFADFSLKNFGIGIYPCTYAQELYPESAIPDLFIAAGALSFDSFVKKTSGFSRIRPRYVGIRFPRGSFLKLAPGKNNLHYGIELSGKKWTTAVFSSFDIKKEEGIQCGFFGRWQEKKILNSAINCSIQHISCFIPVKVKKEPLSNQNAVRSHHALFGLGAMITHPYMAFETIGVCTVLADKGLTGLARAEYNFFYRYIGINTGISYTAPHAIDWNGHTKKDALYIFAQPYTKLGICSIYGLYSFHTQYKNKKLTPFHECGLAVNVKHPIVQWKGEWMFANHLHTLKQQLKFISSPAWFYGYAWFEHASLAAQLYLHHTTKNFSIKKYNIDALISCSFLEGWSYGLQVGIHEQLKKEKNSVQEAKTPYDWNPCCAGKVFLKVKKQTANAVHSVQIHLGGKTIAPYFDLSLAYTVQTH